MTKTKDILTIYSTQLPLWTKMEIFADYIVHIFTNITEATQIRDEHQILYDQVPCNILLIDKNFRIAKANKRLRDYSGQPGG